MTYDLRRIPGERPGHKSGLRKLVTSKATRRVAAVLFMLTDVILIAFIALPIPFGGKWIMVLSGSMTPTMLVGGMVLMMPAHPASIQEGDIISLNPPGYPDVVVAHRVIEVIEGASPSFRTMGDANEEEDQYITTAENVVGDIRMHIPLLGYILEEVGEFGQTPLGMVLLMGVPSLLVVAGETRNILSARDPRKRRQKIIKDRIKKRTKAFKK